MSKFKYARLTINVCVYGFAKTFWLEHFVRFAWRWFIRKENAAPWLFAFVKERTEKNCINCFSQLGWTARVRLLCLFILVLPFVYLFTPTTQSVVLNFASSAFSVELIQTAFISFVVFHFRPAPLRVTH